MPVIHEAKSRFSNPARTIVFSFLIVITVGALLLTLPISSRSGELTSPVDAFFTAISATCVTGFLLHDTYNYWNAFGQSVILAMIQLGGLGFVTFATFFNFAIGKKLGLRSMQVANESFNMAGFSDIRALVPAVIKISLVCELIGAALLSAVFVPEYGGEGVFMAVFTSVSAFCNAGIDLCGMQGDFSSLTHYCGNPLVMITVMLLMICGGLGFVVWVDLLRYRKSRKLMLHSKIVLIATAILIALGAIAFMLLEWDNPGTIGDMSAGGKLSAAIFQSVAFRTAGFHIVPLEDMHGLTKILIMLLAYIGGASGSTAGGIKITTAVVVVMTVISVLRSKPDTEIFGRRIEKHTVYKSLAIITLSLLAVAVVSVIIFYINPHAELEGIDVAFDTVSAFSTLGITTGAAAKVGLSSRLLLAFMMFLGRIGPVSLGLSLMAGADRHSKNQIVPEGKIIVG